MLLNPLFTDMTLQNRLGQDVHLHVCHILHYDRTYVFVSALAPQASSFFGKNAEPFAMQLREAFAIDVRNFEIIELRKTLQSQPIYRWRFEWIGNSPVSARGEEVVAISQRTMLLSLIESRGHSAASA